MSEIDPNEIAAKVVLGSIDRAVGTFGRVVDGAQETISLLTRAGFKSYKKEVEDNYGYVRTILHRDKPIPLPDLYVSTSFMHQGKIVKDDDLISLISKPCKVLVVGTAGGGKSVFLRLINMAAAQAKGSFLPVFIELKNLNPTPDKTIIDLIVDYFTKNGLDLKADSFRSLLAKGRVLIILDGFDEINHDRREDYANQISELCKNYKKASIVASSRPDELISSVERFSIYRVRPFEKDQAIQLLEKLPYDPDVKSKFISEVNDELYDRHKEFLSNPLLITMMLMTYHQFAEIPSKIHLFYQHAFATLFSWHDSSKDVFKRKSYTNLPMDEFQRVFSYFCFDGYMDQRFSFSESDVLERLRSALTAENSQVEPEDLLKDLLISTCLMQRDGLNITFVHRSFQEYFAALYISRLDDKNARLAIDGAATRAFSDLVLPMIFEMNPSLFERAWALPTLKAMIKHVDGIDPLFAPLTYFSRFFEEINLSTNKLSMTYSPSIWGSRMIGVARVYPGEVKAFEPGEKEDGILEFARALANDSALLTKMNEEYGAEISKKEIADCNFSLLLKKNPVEVCDYINLGKWSISEHRKLLALRDELSQRVASRRASFKGALARRARNMRDIS